MFDKNATISPFSSLKTPMALYEENGGIKWSNLAFNKLNLVQIPKAGPLSIDKSLWHCTHEEHEIDKIKSIFVILIPGDFLIQQAFQTFFSRITYLASATGGLAHDVNNPITVILGYADQLRRFKPESPPVAEKFEKGLHRIIDACNKVAKLVNSTREVLRPSHNDDMRTILLDFVISNVTGFYSTRLINHGIQIEVQIPQDVRVLCRPLQVAQILFSLIMNSYEVLNGKPDAKISIVTDINYEQKQVVIKYSDTSQGSTNIEQSLQTPHLSNYLDRAGISLYCCKQLIENMGGKFDFLPPNIFHITLKSGAIE